MSDLYSEIKNVRPVRSRKTSSNFIPGYMLKLAKEHFNLDVKTIRIRLMKAKPEYVNFFAELTKKEMDNYNQRKLELKNARKTKNKILRDLRKLKPMVD